MVLIQQCGFCPAFFYLLDHVQEAIQELELMKDKRDVSLCALMALVYAQKKRSNPGRHGELTYSHYHKKMNLL